MTIHEEIEDLRMSMDKTDDFETYLELTWRLNFLEMSLAAELEDYDLAA